MNQRSIILVFAVFITSFAILNTYIDPTVTYILESKTKKRGEDIYGYTGQIQVKKIAIDTIVMTFEVNKGAPSYNSGSFVDTLIYNNNAAIYTNAEFDTTCKITFSFNKK